MDAKAFSDVGVADPVPALARPAGDLGLHPAEAERVADLPEDEVGGEGEQEADPGQLRELVEREDRAGRAVRRGRRPGRRLVHGPVLRAVLPDHDAEARLEDGVHHRGDRARDRHGAVRLLRLAVRQDRPQEDHDGRLPARRADLLPDLQGDDARREPRARALHGGHADHGDGERLPGAPVPAPEDGLHRLRQGAATCSRSAACRSKASRAPKAPSRSPTSTASRSSASTSRSWSRR